MAAPRPAGGQDLFDTYFRRADLDGDGHISGAEAVAFFQGSNLPKHVLAQVWAYADSKKAGFLGRAEFYNALKLVTVAQSKRELTPEIVKAALYSPASASIPAPKINLAATPSPQPRAVTPVSQATGAAPLPSMAAGIRSSNIPQVVPGQQFRGPPQANYTAPRPVNQSVPPNWPSGNVTTQAPLGQNHFGLRPPSAATTLQPRPQMPTKTTNDMPQGSSPPPAVDASGSTSTQPVVKDPKEVTASGNGAPSDSIFGDVFSDVASQPKHQSTTTTSSMSGSTVTTGTVTSVGPQPVIGQNSVRPQGPLGQQPAGAQNQFAGKPGHQFVSSGAAALPAGNSAYGHLAQPQAPWPKMMPADVQKYAKVFVQVDTDRDGKITGHQARNLFLSWKLPREALKQIWDLSDQDNDSNLSLREFCIAVYLMERYREGRPLPPSFPSTVITSESMFSLPGQPVARHGNASWGAAHGFQQQQVPGASRPPPGPKGKPPRPVPVPLGDGAAQPTQPPKRKIPELEKHMVDQLSKEEQESLNSKFEEAATADKKVEELEKEIAESKQKIDFFRTKMQELVLYKSRCDNRFNEITERVSADKREVESLAKKYEEKYKQSGNVGSKLTIEEATFRDIQEKKMEMYQAIVKFEEGKLGDGVIKERTEHIQSGLEELVKTLNERCKQYGLRGKPTSLVELPFGWQPGIQEGAADWDEDWDKLEEEGYAFVKDLTLDVQNVVAPPKERKPIDKKEESSDVSLSNGGSKAEGVTSDQPDAKTTDSDGKEKDRSHDDDDDSTVAKGIDTDGSPHSKNTRSDNDHDHGHDEDGSPVYGGKTFDEPGWGHYDSHYDSDSVSSFKPDGGKDKDSGFGFGIGFDDFSIKPIKTGSNNMANFPSEKISVFADSVPSTPADSGNLFASNMFSGKSSYFDESVPSTPAYAAGGNNVSVFPEKKSFFDDSVPSTPAYPGNLFPEKNTSSFFDDSVPSTPAYPGNLFPDKKTSSFFDDSVPSTPAYSVSDFGGKPFSSETPRSDNNLFAGSSPFMFDSVPSTPAANRSSENYGFDRFDSFNSNSNDAFTLSRMDSMRSNTTEPDPFASTRFDSFNYKSYDSFNASGSFETSSNVGPPQQGSLARFDSIRSSADSDYSHGFGFEDSDPFGSTGPFKSSAAAETPKKPSDHWNAF